MKNKKFYFIFFIEISIVCLGTFLYFNFDSSDIYRLLAGDTKLTQSSNICDLHKSNCSIDTINNGTITFDIEPKSIPLMKTLTFSVTTSKNIPLDTLILNIYATNMNMGYNTFSLKKISDKMYQAKGILPTCIVGGMKWKAEVVANELTKSYGAIFKFKTK